MFILGPTALEAENVIYILFGAKVPFCLKSMRKRYLLINEYYVHDLMKREMKSILARDELHEKMFNIV